jgi:hypothetical protein
VAINEGLTNNYYINHRWITISIPDGLQQQQQQQQQTTNNKQQQQQQQQCSLVMTDSLGSRG